MSCLECISFTLMLCLHAYVAVNGFPGSNFVAKSSSERVYKAGNVKVENWDVVEAQEFHHNKDGTITSRTHGVYLIGYTISMKGPANGFVQACIGVNKNSRCNTLVSVFNVTSSGNSNIYQSLHATGLLKLFEGDVISVNVVATISWTLLQHSTFFGYFLHEYGMAPAFYVNPSEMNALDNRKKFLVRRWDTAGTKGGFVYAPSFSKNLGVFSIRKSGLYFIGINVIFKKTRDKEVYVVTLVNGNNNLLERTFKAGNGVVIVTVSIHTVSELKSGTKLFAHVQKAGASLSKILPSSGFSVVLLQRAPGSINGFSIKSVNGEKYPSGQNLLKLTRFTDAVIGGFNSFKQTGYFAQNNGYYLMCFNFEVFCPETTKCTVSINFNDVEVVLHAIGRSPHIFTSRCLITFMKEGDLFSLKTYSKSQWYLKEESSISLIMLQETYPALSLRLPITSNTAANIWVKVNQQLVRRSGFQFSLDSADGDYIVSETGIYQVFANIIIRNLKKTTVTACVAIEGNPSWSDGLISTNTGLSGTHTLTISSAIFLKKKQRVSIFVKVIDKENWELDDHSSFSMIYLGDKELLAGFQTTLFDDVMYRSTGWRTPSAWNKPRDITSKPWSFALHMHPSRFGFFNVPVTGLYYTAANIIFSRADLIADGSIFIGMITVNDSMTSNVLYKSQSSKQYPTQNDVFSEFTISISAVLYLKKGDIVSVKVCSKSDTVWMIRKETGFSVILLSKARPALSNAFLACHCVAPNEHSNGLSINWTINKDDQKLFSIGEGLKLTDDEIFILETGLYTIVINIQLPQNGSQDVEVALLNTLANTRTLCAKVTQIYADSFVSCNILALLHRGARFKVHIQSTRQNRAVTVGPESSLSVFEMERPSQYPWIYAELQENILDKEKLKIDEWIFHNKETGYLLGHQGIGHLGINRERYFNGLVLVTTNIVFDRIAKGNCTISLSDRSGNKTLSSITSRYNPNRINQITFSVSHVFNIDSDGVSMAINAPEFFINKRTSFSMSYVPFDSKSFVFMRNLDQRIQTSGDTVLKGWSCVDYRNNANDGILAKDTVYFISVIYVAEFSMEQLQLKIKIDNKDTIIRWNFKRHATALSSYTFTGFVIPKVSGKMVVSVQLSKGHYFNLDRESRIYVVSLGDASTTHGVILQLKGTKIYFDRAKSWLELSPKLVAYKNGIVAQEDAIIVRKTGIYLVSLAVSIITRESSTYDTLITVNGEMRSSSFARQEINGNGTISFVNSLYLQRGMFINALIFAHERTYFAVKPESTLSIMLLKDLDSDLSEKLLPTIYKDILPPGNHFMPLGRSFTLRCHSIADDRIVYNWFRNGNLTQSSYSATITLAGKLKESGEYYCETTASETIAMSKPVKVQFFDIDECLKGTHSCTGRNQTCVNLPGTYKCGCDPGLQMERGECKKFFQIEKKSKEEDTKRLNLPVAVVVLAPIAICVFIFLIVVALYTYYKSKKAATQRLLRHSGSFSEQIQLHREEETSFCQQYYHSDGQAEDQETEEQMNSHMTNKELKEVRFSLQTECNSENFDIEDDGSPSDNRAWLDDDYLSPRTI